MRTNCKFGKDDHCCDVTNPDAAYLLKGVVKQCRMLQVCSNKYNCKVECTPGLC